MASHASLHLRDPHRLTGIGTRVAVLALQPHRQMLLVAIRNRLLRRNGRIREEQKEQPDHSSPFFILSARYAEDRIERAIKVSVGFCAPPLTNALPSTTNNFFTPCA